MIHEEWFNREEIILKSGVRSVFVPNVPIDSVELFSGRMPEVQRIVECMNTEGLHLLLYGDRGVGKTSLSKITCKIFADKGKISRVYIKTCDRNDTFESIIRSLFEDIGIKCVVKGGKTKSVAVSSPMFSLNQSHNVEYESGGDISSPSWVAKKIQNISGVFLIDEIDVLSNIQDKQKIAELIKMLSDSHARLKIFIVGISRTPSELVGGHPSVQRCIKEIKLDRMSETELTEIIKKGEQRLQLCFDEKIKKKIVRISAGFPYFTHLLALKSAEEAIVKEVSVVGEEEFGSALQRAVDDLEGTLKIQYDTAVSGQTIERNKKILLAAAICGEEAFLARTLKACYQRLSNMEITQLELSNFMRQNNVISDGYATILRRVTKGVYIFNDPRMPSFIKLSNGYLE